MTVFVSGNILFLLMVVESIVFTFINTGLVHPIFAACENATIHHCHREAHMFG